MGNLHLKQLVCFFLDFKVQKKTDQLLEVKVPHHRLDIAIPADLVEEIARVYGYNRMPSTLIRDALPPQRENFQLQGVEAIRDILVASGMDEVITYTMTNPLDESNLILQEGFDQKNYVPEHNSSGQIPPAGLNSIHQEGWSWCK